MFEYRDFLFKNRGDGTFADVTPQDWLQDLQPSMGLAYADYDRDGLLDFVLGNWNEGYVLYRNTGASGKSNNWISIRLTGGANINRDAIGSRVYLTTDDGRKLLQEVKCGSSLGAGNDTAIHFGLGEAAISEVLIRWPNGAEDTLTDVAVNQFLEIAYSG